MFIYLLFTISGQLWDYYDCSAHWFKIKKYGLIYILMQYFLRPRYTLRSIIMQLLWRLGPHVHAFLQSPVFYKHNDEMLLIDLSGNSQNVLTDLIFISFVFCQNIWYLCVATIRLLNIFMLLISHSQHLDKVKDHGLRNSKHSKRPAVSMFFHPSHQNTMFALYVSANHG